jgi:hypothetical protein
VPVNSGFGVEASGGSYSAALLQGNLKLLLERNSAAADGLTAAVPPCAVPAAGLPVVGFSSGSMLPQEQQRGGLNARGSFFGGAAAAAGMKSAGGRSGNLGASGCWVSLVRCKGSIADAELSWRTFLDVNSCKQCLRCVMFVVAR